MAVIGIISSYSYLNWEVNYGSLFQYYALQEYLKSKNHKPYWIRYSYRSRFPQKVRGLFGRWFSSSRKEDRDTEEKKNCIRELSRFIIKYINFSKIHYVSRTRLIRICPPRADFYIAGSDKVWSRDPVTYLDFVPKRKKRYSYAASVPEKYKQFGPEEAELLSNFDSLSVRESSTIDMCLEWSINDVLQVVDPTLLLTKDKYSVLARNVEKESEPFVLAYLGTIHTSEQKFSQQIISFCEHLSKKIIIVPIGDRGVESQFPHAEKQRPSPEKWLRLILDADYIITDSYHGTLFSVIMKKPFISIVPKDKPSRPIIDFLTRFGLESRIIRSSDDSISSKMEESINWDEANEKITEAIKISKTFLDSLG